MGEIKNVLPPVTAEPFAVVHQLGEQASEFYAQNLLCETPKDGTQGELWREYTVNNLFWMPDAKAFRLMHTTDSMRSIHYLYDVQTDTTTGSHWTEDPVYTAENGGKPTLYAQWLHQSAFQAKNTSVEWKFWLEHNPTVIFNIRRTDQSVNERDYTRTFRIGFGGNSTAHDVVITWGLGDYGQYCEITYPLRSGGARTYRRKILESESTAMYGADPISFEWDTFGGGEAQLSCSAWQGAPVLLHDVGRISSGTWWVGCSYGEWAVNVVQPRYEKEGYLITPWFDVKTDRSADTLYCDVWGPGCQPDDDPNHPMGTIWRELGGATADIALYEREGTLERYKLTVHGNGYFTPWIQSFQHYYLPKTATDPPRWFEITDYVDGSDGPNGNGDMTPATLTLRLPNHQGAFARHLQDLETKNNVHLLQGQCAIAMSTEYTDVAGKLQRIPRFVGIGNILEDDWPIGGLQRYTITCSDSLSVLGEGELFSFPALTNAPVSTGLSMLCWWYGITANEVIKDPNCRMNLDDPQRNYTKLPWNPTMGENALEFARKIGQYGWGIRAKAIVNNDNPDDAPKRKIEIYPMIRRSEATPKYTISSLPNPVDTEHPLTSIKARIDYTGTINCLTVIGQDVDGKPLIEQYEEPHDQPQGWRYTGQRRRKTIQNTSLLTLFRVHEVFCNEWERAKHPTMSAEIRTLLPELCDLIVGDYIHLRDTETISAYFEDTPVLYRVESVNAQQTVNTVELTIRASEVPMSNAS
jgi:hypothetical protein